MDGWQSKTEQIRPGIIQYIDISLEGEEDLGQENTTHFGM